MADAVGEGNVAVFAQQHVAQIGILLDVLVQLHQVRVGLALGVFRIVPAAHDDQPVRQLVLEAGQQVVPVLIVNIEGAAVDVCDRCQLAHGDVFDALLRHELHQRKPKLPFRLSHSAVYNFFFHSPIPPTCFFVILTYMIPPKRTIINISLHKNCDFFRNFLENFKKSGQSGE